MEPIIKISHLNKSYKDVKAVNDLSFTVNRGELFAFLGVNGAGKSTTIHIICSQLSKDSGEVIIDGYNLDTQKESIKRKLGVVFQNSVLDKDLSAYDNLLYRGSLYGLSKKECQKRIETLSIQLQFKDYLNRSLSKLSGGQKRRIDVARALIHDPEILILDEPTTGLDPQTRNVLWSFIEYLRKEKGMTLFLTTHYMEEAASADSVVILDHGQIVASGSPLDLKNQYANDYITLYGVCEDKVKMLALPYEKIKDAYRIEIKNTRDATSLICQYPSLFVDYEITKGKMDDVFLNITGKKLEGERL
ncbi:MAG: ABC transporter ATP-binding protein [Erysipelotrichaceae bacterium]|nr:ABC transporter ATP-binding protein [Erysipelotrichaceae bacterium]